MKTLQEQYLLVLEGKENKDHFLKQARYLFPDYITKFNNYKETVSILKSKQILTEHDDSKNVINKSTGDLIKLFKQKLTETTKAEEKEISEEASKANKNAYDNKNLKNIDNLNFNEILKGCLSEKDNPKNTKKTYLEIQDIVVKNLAKDPMYYTKNGMFGIDGLGATIEAPGLGEPKEPKGQYKASGYGDGKVDSEIVKNGINNAKKTSKTTGLKPPTLNENLSIKDLASKINNIEDEEVNELFGFGKKKDDISDEEKRQIAHEKRKYGKQSPPKNYNIRNIPMFEEKGDLISDLASKINSIDEGELNEYEEPDGEIGDRVRIHKNLTTDPKHKQGYEGEIIKRSNNHVVIRFDDGTEGLYQYDTFDILSNKNNISEGVEDQIIDLEYDLMNTDNPERKEEIERKIKALESGINE